MLNHAHTITQQNQTCSSINLTQVEEITNVAKERVELAKALIRAHEKPTKAAKGASGGASATAEGASGAGGNEAAAA